MKLLWWKDQFEFKLLRFSRAVHGGWHQTWEVCHWPWHVKSMISVFPNTELDHVEKTDNSWLPTTSQLHFFALHLLCSGSFSTMVAVPEFWFLRSRLCCKDLRSNVPNDHHSLEHRCRTWIAILCYLCSSVRLFHTAGWAMRLCVRRVW